MTAFIEFTDGDFSALIETEGSRRLYPFINGQVKDLTALLYERVYEVAAVSYTPAAALSTDPVDSSAYLVAESEPLVLAGEIVRVTRRYARVPADQISYGKRAFSRPSLDGLNLSGYYAVSFDGGVTDHIFDARKTVAAIAPLVADTKTVTGTSLRSGSVARTGSTAQNGTVARTGSVPITGDVTVAGGGGSSGTRPAFDGSENFTVTGSSTTVTINTLDSSASILSAISTATGVASTFFTVLATSTYVSIQANGFTSAPFKGIGFSTGGEVLDFAGTSGFNIFVQRIPGGGSSGSGTDSYDLQETPALTDDHDLSTAVNTSDDVDLTDTRALTEVYDVPESTRAFTINSHGTAAGRAVAFYNGSRIVARSIIATVPNANTITVPLADVPGEDFAAATCVFSDDAIMRITTGVKDCSVRLIEKFFLPGVTPGISTGADVPSVQLYSDPIGWFGAVISWIADPSIFRAIAVTELGAWQGPILHEVIEEVQVADAIETRDVNA